MLLADLQFRWLSSTKIGIVPGMAGAAPCISNRKAYEKLEVELSALE